MATGFEPISRHALAEDICALLHASDTGKSRALPPDMHDPTLRHVPARPPRAPGPQAEVDLVEVEKVALIQQSNSVKHFLPDDYATAGDPVDPARSILVHLASDNAARKQAVEKAEAQAIEQLVCRSNEPEGKWPIAAVWVFNTSAGNSDLGMSFHELQK